MHLLDYIFKPRALAVIGASSNPGKFGFQFIKYVTGHPFSGKIYPVNPSGGEVFGRKIYPDIRSVDGEIDLAIILTPAHTVLETIKQCADKGVKGIILVTAGFGETGKEGKRLEEEVVSLTHSRGIRMVGPNCIGALNLEIGLNASGISVAPTGVGSMGLISQSGSSLEMLFSLSRERSGYFNKAVSCGNQADLTICDYLEYFADDPNINVIMMYIEGIDQKEGRRFIDLARETVPKKPVVVLKVGRSPVATRVISSHTGSMVGSVESYRAVFRQYGIIEALSFEELFDFGLAFSKGRIPQSNRVALLGPGGPTVSGADVLTEDGIELPEFSSETLASINRVSPSFVAGTKNPLDPTPAFPIDKRHHLFRALMNDENTDGAIICTFAAWYMKKFSETIPSIYAESTKPLLLGSIMSMTIPEVYDAAKVVGEAGIPFFPSPERAAKAYAALVRYSCFKRGLNRNQSV